MEQVRETPGHAKRTGTPASDSEATLDKALENDRAMNHHETRDDASQDGSTQHDGEDLRREFSQRDYIMVRWERGEPENPYNFSTKRKAFIVIAGMLQVINSTLGSALPSGAVKEISAHFKITSSQQLTLPISAYLIGYIIGPLLFGPLSETYGRRWVMISSFFIYIVWTMASALAPNFTALCFFRLFSGVVASSPIVVIGGLYADIFADPITRGKAMAVFMACTTWGPTISPVISGFVGKVGWQWPFWVGLAFAGASFLVLCFLPETYGPILLREKARRLRKQYPDRKYLAKIELESTGLRDIVTRVLFRPLSMVIHESIVSFTCLYLSLIYGIFYLYFEAYPFIFQEMYHLNPGVAGLAFVPIAVGSFFAFFIFLFYDAYLRRAQHANKPWSLQEEYQRLPLAMIGGPALSIGVFWLAWAAWPYLHPIVPMLAGIPFGIGFLLIFMALINYLADAYEIYAASAMAATSTTRSVFGAVLPLAAEPMYARLGIHWATSLLGFASAVMVLIPLAFIRYGPYLREHSKFSLELKKIKAKEEEEDWRAERERSTSSEPGELEKGLGGREMELEAGIHEVQKEAQAQEKDAGLEKELDVGEKDLEAGPSGYGTAAEDAVVREGEQFVEAKETMTPMDDMDKELK